MATAEQKKRIQKGKKRLNALQERIAPFLPKKIRKRPPMTIGRWVPSDMAVQSTGPTERESESGDKE